MSNDIQQLITEFLTSIGISKDYLNFEFDEIISIKIDLPEDERGPYIGHHAQTLDSLQLIISLMVNNQKEDHQRILLDIGGYREVRFEKIKEIVDNLVAEVLETGTSRSISYLSPTERRQVHLLLEDHDQVRTLSQGDGQGRRLFIKPKA